MYFAAWSLFPCSAHRSARRHHIVHLSAPALQFPASQLGELSRQAAKVPQLSAELEQTQQELQVWCGVWCGKAEEHCLQGDCMRMHANAGECSPTQRCARFVDLVIPCRPVAYPHHDPNLAGPPGTHRRCTGCWATPRPPSSC